MNSKSSVCVRRKINTKGTCLLMRTETSLTQLPMKALLHSFSGGDCEAGRPSPRACTGAIKGSMWLFLSELRIPFPLLERNASYAPSLRICQGTRNRRLDASAEFAFNSQAGEFCNQSVARIIIQIIQPISSYRAIQR
jgi:hypothetical protein